MNLIYFVISFIGDSVAAIFYQKYIASNRYNLTYLIVAIIAAFLVWLFYFKLLDTGYKLHYFVPLWAAGTAVFGYFISGWATQVPAKTLLNPTALICIAAIGLGIFFLNRIVN